MNNNRWLQALIILLVVIAASWLAGQLWLFVIQFSNIILLFFLAWLIAFALSPIARRLQAFGMPQLLAVAVVYLALAVVLVGGGLLLFPIIAKQTQDLLTYQDYYIAQLTDLGNNSLAWLQKNWGVRIEDLHIESLYGTIGAQVQNLGSSVLSFVSGLATFLFNTVIILLLSFYFMKDGERIFNNAVAVMPHPLREEAQLFGDSVGRAFGGYLRGQFTFAVLYGILNAIIMAAFHLEYILIVSIVAGLAMLIPFLGNYLAYIPPMLVILVSPNIGNWWLLLIVLLVVQTIMLQVVGPRILSQAVGIHPLFVILALLVGLQIAGAWGALFGIPVAAVLQQVAGSYFARLRAFFNMPAADQPALALVGTVPVATINLPVDDTIPPETPTTPPTSPPSPEESEAPTPPAPPSPPQAALLLIRGLGRRVLQGRRRVCP